MGIRQRLSAARRRLLGLEALGAHMAAIDRHLATADQEHLARLSRVEERLAGMDTEELAHLAAIEERLASIDEHVVTRLTSVEQHLTGAGRVTIALDYPVEPTPRWGWGHEVHPELYAIINERRSSYEDVLRACAAHHADYSRIGLHPSSDITQPHWDNGYFSGLDGMVLYSELVRRDPALYLEVGSGHSTRFARRAIRDHGLRTRVVSLDPDPRAECDVLCDEVIRQPLEYTDLSIFRSIQSGDIAFFDGTHRVFTNSDTTVFLLEVMPRLAPGCLVHLHDILLPWDYLPSWNDRYYSEQYLLASHLLARGNQSAVYCPNYFVSNDRELHALVRPVWDDPAMRSVERHGTSFWLCRS